MSWTELFKFVGGGTALLAVSAWLIRSLMFQVFSRDIEKYKSLLKKESDKELEALKTSLSIAASKSQIRFSKLQERRAGIIEDAYKKLVALENLASYLTTEAETESYERLKERADEFIDEFFEFNSFFENHAIYFSEDMIDKIKDLNGSTFHFSLNIVYYSKSDDATSFIRAFQEKEKSFGSKNKEIRKLIESEFRKLLGVID